MAIGIIGRKAGMTRVFTEAGESIPVTVIEAQPNRVTQVKSEDTDGYNALQVTRSLIQRFHNYKDGVGIQEPIHVMAPHTEE